MDNKEVRAWRDSHCKTMPIVEDHDGVPVCCVLGERFGYLCRNRDGERCRYSNLGDWLL